MKKKARINEMAEHLAKEIERTHGADISESIVASIIEEYMKEHHLKFVKEIGD